MTFNELQSYDMGEGEKVPKLEEFLTLICPDGKPKLFANIEVKAPHDLETRERYNFLEAIRKVHSLIVSHGV